MQATQTVIATLQDYFVAHAEVVKIQPKGTWIAEMRQNPHVLPYFYGIGLGALEVLAQHNKQQSALFERLFQSLSRLRTEATTSCVPDYLSLRANFTHCAWQCLQAALTVSKGEGLNPHSRISQLYREIVQFNALATVPEYIDKTLDE